MALITQGLSNQEIADRSYLSYQLGQDLHPHGLPQDGRRTHRAAVLWGIKHGFEPDEVRHVDSK